MYIVPTIATTRSKRHASRWRKKRLISAAMLAASVAGAQSSMSLHEAAQQAMRSPSIEVLEAQVSAARGVLRQARLGLNPRLFFQSEDLRPWASGYDFATQTENYGYLSQTFETAGKRRRRSDLAELRLHQTEASVAQERMQLIGRVAQAYWNSVAQTRIVDLLEKDMQVVEQMVQYHQKRVDAGATRGVDLLRIKLERDRLRLALEGERRLAMQARIELFRQMGQPVTNVQLGSSLEELRPMPPADDATVLQQRPDVQAARTAVQVAEADLRLQKAQGVPDIDLLGGYKRNAADNTLFAGLQMFLPVRNRNQGEIDRATANVHAAQAAFSLLEQQVRADLAKARSNYMGQQEIVQRTLPDVRAHAEENFKIVREAYGLGGVDLLRLLDAERTEFDIEVSAVRALVELQQSSVQLQLVEGLQP